MSSGPDNVTSTTNTEPPSYLQGPLRSAATAVMQDFGQMRRGGGYNPYTNLDQQFNRAADLTRTRLSSEFAGSGRNLEAALPARSDELQTLAANIYDPMTIRSFDPTNQLIDRLAALIPNAGGVTRATQPVFRTGLF